MAFKKNFDKKVMFCPWISALKYEIVIGEKEDIGLLTVNYTSTQSFIITISYSLP